MEYAQVKKAVDVAWDDFFHTLSNHGFTSSQIVTLEKLINYKDSFNDVFDCVMEVVR